MNPFPEHFTLAPFTPADAPAWVALTNSLLGRNTLPERLLAEDERERLSLRWVVYDGEKLVSVARLNSFAFIPPDFLQASVIVAPDYRGKGIGSRLWDTMRQAVPAEVRGLSADVADTDPTSREWAERRGFGVHVHRYASELDLAAFDETPFSADWDRLHAGGVRVGDMVGAEADTEARLVDLIAELLTHTPDLAGLPRWSAEQVREVFHMNSDPHPEWQLLALGPQGEWLGLTVMVRYGDMAYNEFTAILPQARGRGLALPLKLEAIRRAQAAGLKVMRTNNHSENAPMLAVNRRLGFVPQVGRWEMRWQRSISR